MQLSARKYLGRLDCVEERGQEQLFLDKKIGSGAGALLKYLEKVGVRVCSPSRITKPFLERYAHELDRCTLYFEEISILYPNPQSARDMKTMDSDLATCLRQAIERQKINLLVCEKDARGNITPKTIVSDARFTVIATSVTDIKDLAMISRMNRYSLPYMIGEHAKIVQKLSNNIGIGTDEIEKRKQANLNNLTDDDVKLIYHSIFVLNQGSLANDEEARKLFNPHYLQPVSDFEIKREYRHELLKAWLRVLVEHNLKSGQSYSIEYEKKENSENRIAFTSADLLELIDRNDTDTVVERLNAMNVIISRSST
jgi:hypothetical protein